MVDFNETIVPQNQDFFAKKGGRTRLLNVNAKVDTELMQIFLKGISNSIDTIEQDFAVDIANDTNIVDIIEAQWLDNFSRNNKRWSELNKSMKFLRFPEGTQPEELQEMEREPSELRGGARRIDKDTIGIPYNTWKSITKFYSDSGEILRIAKPQPTGMVLSGKSLKWIQQGDKQFSVSTSGRSVLFSGPLNKGESASRGKLGIAPAFLWIEPRNINNPNVKGRRRNWLTITPKDDDEAGRGFAIPMLRAIFRQHAIVNLLDDTTKALRAKGVKKIVHGPAGPRAMGGPGNQMRFMKTPREFKDIFG